MQVTQGLPKLDVLEALKAETQKSVRVLLQCMLEEVLAAEISLPPVASNVAQPFHDVVDWVNRFVAARFFRILGVTLILDAERSTQTDRRNRKTRFKITGLLLGGKLVDFIPDSRRLRLQHYTNDAEIDFMGSGTLTESRHSRIRLYYPLFSPAFTVAGQLARALCVLIKLHLNLRPERAPPLERGDDGALRIKKLPNSSRGATFRRIRTLRLKNGFKLQHGTSQERVEPACQNYVTPGENSVKLCGSLSLSRVFLPPKTCDANLDLICNSVFAENEVISCTSTIIRDYISTVRRPSIETILFASYNIRFVFGWDQCLEHLYFRGMRGSVGDSIGDGPRPNWLWACCRKRIPHREGKHSNLVYFKNGYFHRSFTGRHCGRQDGFALDACSGLRGSGYDSITNSEFRRLTHRTVQAGTVDPCLIKHILQTNLLSVWLSRARRADAHVANDDSSSWLAPIFSEPQLQIGGFDALTKIALKCIRGFLDCNRRSLKNIDGADKEAVVRKDRRHYIQRCKRDRSAVLKSSICYHSIFHAVLIRRATSASCGNGLFTNIDALWRLSDAYFDGRRGFRLFRRRYSDDYSEAEFYHRLCFGLMLVRYMLSLIEKTKTSRSKDVECHPAFVDPLRGLTLKKRRDFARSRATVSSPLPVSHDKSGKAQSSGTSFTDTCRTLQTERPRPLPAGENCALPTLRRTMTFPRILPEIASSQAGQQKLRRLRSAAGLTSCGSPAELKRRAIDCLNCPALSTPEVSAAAAAKWPGVRDPVVRLFDEIRLHIEKNSRAHVRRFKYAAIWCPNGLRICRVRRCHRIGKQPFFCNFYNPEDVALSSTWRGSVTSSLKSVPLAASLERLLSILTTALEFSDMPEPESTPPVSVAVDRATKSTLTMKVEMSRSGIAEETAPQQMPPSVVEQLLACIRASSDAMAIELKAYDDAFLRACAPTVLSKEELERGGLPRQLECWWNPVIKASVPQRNFEQLNILNDERRPLPAT